jgi:hypothetical protein
MCMFVLVHCFLWLKFYMQTILHSTMQNRILFCALEIMAQNLPINFVMPVYLNEEPEIRFTGFHEIVYCLVLLSFVNTFQFR